VFDVENADEHESMNYNKGENRHKHCGNDDEAQLVWQSNLLIGKCPKGFDLALALDLLNNGIPEYRKTSPENPFRIWNYHKGAIYATRSDDRGVTWHGYPCPANEVPRKIMQQLQERASKLGEEDNLKQWMNKSWKK
jgi:hypothetical protein